MRSYTVQLKSIAFGVTFCVVIKKIEPDCVILFQKLHQFKVN